MDEGSLKAQRERHKMLHQASEMKISLGDIVLIKGDEKNTGSGILEWLASYTATMMA